MDDKIKKYQIVNSLEEREEVTEQELYEFYLLWEHGITDNFEDFKKKLDEGEIVCADDKSRDWWTGTIIHKGFLKIKKIEDLPPDLPKEIITNRNCSHKNKYINEAGNIKFWFCKDCRSDLGDA